MKATLKRLFLAISITIFLFKTPDRAAAQIFTSLYKFNPETTDGQQPEGALVLSSNILYGTASGGGATGMGTIFKVNIDGTSYQTIHNFTATQSAHNTNSDGASPSTGLVASDNTLYGAAYHGGAAGLGTIYSLDISGSNFTTLFSFPAGPNNTQGQDGQFPESAVILSGNTLYGTTGSGGPGFGVGTLYSVSTNGTNFSLEHVFEDGGPIFPQGNLTLSGDTLYGMAVSDNIFRINTNGGAFTNLFSFDSVKSNTDTNSTGSTPEGSLAVSGNRIFGTADEGGTNGDGTIFALNTDGMGFTNMHNFTGGADGAHPFSGLTLVGGTLYGTTQSGGALNHGAIFSIKTDGSAFTTLYSFEGTNGAVPEGALIYSEGNLYGTTASGGSVGAGTIFSLSLIYVQISATPTNGVAPLTVNFTSSAFDNEGNAITNWNWNFGDGSTSTEQNPSHTYTAFGTYTADLTTMNANGVQLADSSPSITVKPNFGLVLNGGFEDFFDDWNTFGVGSLNSVSDGTGSGIMPESGNYEFVVGTSSDPGYLSQTLSTKAGATYLLSFGFANPYGDPGQFGVFWNGSTLLDTTNVDDPSWTNMQFIVTATGTSTVLEFGFLDNYHTLTLDSVSVLSVQPAIPSISSATVSGANLVLNAVNGQSGGTYTVLTSTNLNLPASQWTPVAINYLTATGNFSLTITNTVNPALPRQFYILQTQ